MKIQILKSSFVLALMLSYQGCGTADRTTDIINIIETQGTQTTKVTKIDYITEDNFVELAKYHYMRQSMITQQQTSVNRVPGNHVGRSYPGQKIERVNTNMLKVRSLKSKDSVVEKLLISDKESKVTLDIGKEYVFINFYNQNGNTTNKKLTLKEFNTLIKGEEI